MAGHHGTTLRGVLHVAVIVLVVLAVVSRFRPVATLVFGSSGPNTGP